MESQAELLVSHEGEEATGGVARPLDDDRIAAALDRRREPPAT
jgi:hypothetical protein